MLKRHAITVLFFISCAINLGHSFFPHSHEVEHHHHNGHHHHDKQSNESGLSHFFLHFNHASDHFIKGHSDEEVRFINVNAAKAIITEIADVTFDFFYCSSELSLKKFRAPFIFISPHLSSFQFRGPPTT